MNYWLHKLLCAMNRHEYGMWQSCKHCYSRRPQKQDA